MPKANLLLGILFIMVSVMIIKIIYSERIKMKKSGKVIFESSRRSTQNLGNVVLYSVLFIVSIKYDLLVQWMYHGMQMMFIIFIIISVARGIRKTQICEKVIISPEFVVEWTDVTDYKWEVLDNEYSLLRIDLNWKSNSVFGYKNKNVQLKIMKSEIDFVDSIFKELSIHA